MTYTETDIVRRIESLAGADLAGLDQEQRDQLDQFHAGGSEAVDRLLPGLRLEPGMTVLDVGSGLGGPARQVARATGCRVVGVDITRPYVDAAIALTEAAGLSDRVAFVCADVASLERSDFGAAYTMHVQMNVSDKAAFFAAIAARLVPGARLATFEVCRSGPEAPTLPLPWSIDGTDSFLDQPERLRATIEEAGFTTLEWVDETAWVRGWFAELGSRLGSQRGPTATLPALLDDGLRRVLNFAVALEDGVLTVHRGAFART